VYDPLTVFQFMHNGEVCAGCPPREAYADHCQINQFHKIKRKLQQSLPEELFLYPTGYTGWSGPALATSVLTHDVDSEWAFMVFLSKVRCPLEELVCSGADPQVVERPPRSVI
jgi:hypothetical protein